MIVGCCVPIFSSSESVAQTRLKTGLEDVDLPPFELPDLAEIAKGREDSRARASGRPVKKMSARDSELIRQDLNHYTRHRLMDRLSTEFPATRKHRWASWKKLADAGHAAPAFLTGLRLEAGAGVEEDHSAARDMYRRAAALGFEPAKRYLAVENLYSRFADEREEGFQSLKTLANNGDADAIYQLSVAYYIGKHVTKDYKTALKLATRAADGLHAGAINSIGWMYKKGHGVAVDQKKAADHFRISHQAGCLTATCNLGLQYQRGEGVTLDPEKGLQFLEEAADRGNPRAMVLAGYAHRNGNGTEPNAKVAYEWFEAAAKKDYPIGVGALADCYRNGVGCIKDPVMAYRNYVKAAVLSERKGDHSGWHSVGVCFQDGIGVPMDELKARRFFLRAGTIKQRDTRMETLLELANTFNDEYFARMFREREGVIPHPR